MIRIKACLGIGYAGAEHKTVMEFDDNETAEDIEACVMEWANNYIDIGWSEI